MGYAGEDPVLTPHFDQFAADALVFNQSCATRPICSPNRASLVTALYPQHHGHYMNGLKAPLNPALPTVGTWLKDAGYRTSYVGKLHTGGRAEEQGVIPESFRRPWDNWMLGVGHKPFHQPYYMGRSSTPTYHDGWAPDFETEQTIEFIRGNRQQPFAAFLSWGPPHTGSGKGFEDRFDPGKHTDDGKPAYGSGFAAPANYETPYRPYEKLPRRPNVRPIPVGGGLPPDPTGPALPGYFGACTAEDHSFGVLLEALRKLDLYDNTLIVFTSDHGEMLGGHGRMHKGVFYEESIGVPLLMRLGRQLPARRVNNLISTIDLVPTMLGLTGAPLPAKVDGTDYSAFCRGHAAKTTDALNLSFDAGGPQARPDQPTGKRRAWRTVRTERYSYSALDGGFSRSMPKKSRRVLFDLAEDPYQMQPITGGKHQALMDDLHGRLAAHLTATGDDFMNTKFVW